MKILIPNCAQIAKFWRLVWYTALNSQFSLPHFGKTVKMKCYDKRKMFLMHATINVECLIVLFDRFHFIFLFFIFCFVSYHHSCLWCVRYKGKKVTCRRLNKRFAPMFYFHCQAKIIICVMWMIGKENRLEFGDSMNFFSR